MIWRRRRRHHPPVKPAPIPTPEPQPPKPPPGSAPIPFPEKAVGGYWMKWKGDSPPLGQVDTRFNVIYLAFALGGDGGGLQWDQQVQTQASFLSDINKCRAGGQRILLSIGGQDGNVDISTESARQAVFDSIISIAREFPLDGIDWDLEGSTMNSKNAVANLVWISRRCKAYFGLNFAITMAPPGGPIATKYRQAAKELGPDLTAIGQQLYDYPATQVGRQRDVLDVVTTLRGTYGLKTSQIMIGMRSITDSGAYQSDSGTSNFWSTSSVADQVSTMKTAYTGFRGYYVWEIGSEARLGNRWVAAVTANN